MVDKKEFERTGWQVLKYEDNNHADVLFLESCFDFNSVLGGRNIFTVAKHFLTLSAEGLCSLIFCNSNVRIALKSEYPNV